MSKNKALHQVVHACSSCSDGPCKTVCTNPCQEPDGCPYGVGDARWRSVHSPADDLYELLESRDGYEYGPDMIQGTVQEWVYVLTGNAKHKSSQLLWLLRDAQAEDQFISGIEFDETEKGKLLKNYTKQEIAEAVALDAFQIGIMYTIRRLQKERDGIFEEGEEEWQDDSLLNF